MPRVFISCVTAEFGAYRVEIAKYLRRAGCDVKVQEDFAQVPEDTIQKLDACIRECDAVVHILGEAVGAIADKNAVTAYLSAESRFLDALREVGDFNELQISYTQWEAFLAAYHGIPLYVYQATVPINDGHPTKAAGFDHDWSTFEPLKGDRDLVAKHRDRLKSLHNRRYASPFEALTDLFGQFIGDLRKITQTAGQNLSIAPRGFKAYHPQKVPAYFSGRHDELRQLDDRLTSKSPCVVAVIGFGGQGKSTLLDHWRREQKTFPFESGFGCTADLGGFNFEDFLDECLKFFLGDNFRKQEMVSVDERRRKLVELLGSSKTLIVIDGLERWLRGWQRGPHVEGRDHESDPRDRNGAFDGLDAFLEEMTSLDNGTHLVLTTRALPAVLESAALAVVPVDEEGKHLSLEGLSDADAVTLLRSIGVDGSDAELVAAARCYENHPLAVSIVGRVLVSRHGGRLAGNDRLRLFDQKHAKGREQIFSLFAEMEMRLPRGEADRTFLGVASLCIEDAAIQTILAGIGVADPHDLSIIDDAIDQAVDLASWGLLYWDGVGQKIGLHALIKQHFGSRVENPADIHTRLSNWYGNRELPVRAMSLEDIRFRFLAIEHAAKAGDFKRCAELTLSQINREYSFVEWLVAWGHLSQGQDLLARMAEAAPASEKAVFAISRSVLLRELGRLDESIAILDQLIPIECDGTMPVLDSNALAVAQARANRANAIWQLGDFTKALKEYDLALQVLERLVFSGAALLIDVAKLRMNRANALHSAGQLHRALDDNDKALAILRIVERKGDLEAGPEIALALTNQSVSLGALRDYPAAKQTLATALDTYEKLIAAGREELFPQVAYAQAMLGSVLSDAGESESAASVLTEAEARLDEFVRIGRTDLEWLHGLVFLNRGIAFQRMSQSSAALDDLHRATSIFDKLLNGGRHDVGGWLAHCLMTRSETRYSLSDYTGADSDREQGFHLADDYIENGHPGVHLLLFRRVVAAAIYQPKADVTKWLVNVFSRTEHFFDIGFGSEHLRLEVENLLPRLEAVLPRLEKLGFNPQTLFHLKQRLETLK